MKWDSIEPQPGTFSFTGGDAIAALAKANNQILRCHTLVWHQQLPLWVTNGTWTAATLTAALQNHITNEVTHYKGQCAHWDVVNEALNDNGTFRESVFFRVIGPDYIKSPSKLPPLQIQMSNCTTMISEPSFLVQRVKLLRALLSLSRMRE